MSIIGRVVRRLRDDGLVEFLRGGVPIFYDQYVAPLLPRRCADYNGVTVRSGRLFDSLVPWRRLDRPHYESGLVAGIHDYAEAGDDVVIVGGGWGATAVIAARLVGESGHVTVYEGSKTWVERSKNTIRTNGVEDLVTVVHGIVGPSVNLRSESGDAREITPTDLPECQVLELDCEGAELQILKHMEIRPRTILVESHGMQGATSSAVSEQLENMSYSIRSKVVADEGLHEACIADDVYAITAVRE